MKNDVATKRKCQRSWPRSLYFALRAPFSGYCFLVLSVLFGSTKVKVKNEHHRAPVLNVHHVTDAASLQSNAKFTKYNRSVGGLKDRWFESYATSLHLFTLVRHPDGIHLTHLRLVATRMDPSFLVRMAFIFS